MYYGPMGRSTTDQTQRNVGIGQAPTIKTCELNHHFSLLIVLIIISWDMGFNAPMLIKKKKLVEIMKIRVSLKKLINTF